MRSSPEGFEAAFDLLFPRLVRNVRRLVHDQGIAEEIAAEAFARAWSRWARVGTMPWRDAWILRVGINLALDHLRRRQAFTAQAQPDGWEDHVALRLALVEALRRLPRRQRDVVVLRCLADLPEATVAESLHIAPRTVSEHLTRGLNRLRVQLGEERIRRLPRALET